MKKVIIIIVLILCFGASSYGGYMASSKGNWFKTNKKEEVKEESNIKEEDRNTEAPIENQEIDQPVEEPAEEPKVEEPPVEEGNKEQAPVEEPAKLKHEKPKANSKYKFIKEYTYDVLLNDEIYNLTNFYYKDKKSGETLKEIYFENLALTEPTTIQGTTKTADKDIKKAPKTVSKFKDVATGEEYLLLTLDSSFEYCEDEDACNDHYFTSKMIVRTNGVVYADLALDGDPEISSAALRIRDPKEILDRKYYINICSSELNYHFNGDCMGHKFSADRVYKYYAVYDLENPDDDGYELFDVKSDHIFTLDHDTESGKYLDYVYFIENGTWKKQLLKEYDSSAVYEY